MIFSLKSEVIKHIPTFEPINQPLLIMKKSLSILFMALLYLTTALGQTGFVENFDDGNLVGWSASADYELTNLGNELRIVSHKTSAWNSFSFSFAAADISANPYVRMKIRSDVDFNINFFINTDQSYGNGGNAQEIIHSDGYTEYIFDFSAGQTADLTNANLLNFVFNPGGARGCNATVYFDDIRIGDQAPAMPSISRIPDQFHSLNAGNKTIPFWRVKDLISGATPLTVSATSSNTGLIPDPSVSYTSGNTSGTLSYTPVSNQAGTAIITVTTSGNAPADNVMQFAVTVESNKAPKINSLADINIQNNVLTNCKLTGLDDGDANANQTLTITAISSNTSILPNPVVTYVSGGFDAILGLHPLSGQTGTVSVTVTVQDNGGTIAGGNDTQIMEFDVHIFNEVNNPPAVNELVDLSILQDDPQQIVYLRGITDGDESMVQNISISATSSNPSIIPHPSVFYTPGAASGELHFTPVAGQIGNATITVTLTDDGGNVSNNGNESTTYTFDVEVRVKPISGWEDDFNDGILGPQWPAAWGDPGENTHLCTEHDGAMQIQVDKARTNNIWAGLWFNIPTELDLSKNPYISITMRTNEAPKDMLIFLWDAYDHYNTAKTVRHTVSGSYVEYFFDYSDPSFQLQGDGTEVDISRIKALLINFAPGAMYTGNFFFDDFRVGDKAHRAPVTPVVTLDPIPDFALPANSPQQTIGITNLTDGATGANTVTVTATSSNPSLVPNPVAGEVSANKSTLTFTPAAGQTGTAIITVTASAAGSTSKVRTFKVIVAALDNTAADVTIDLSTTYQEIDGFGAFMGSGGASADTIISLASDIGMSMARFGLIGGGFEEVNDNSDPLIINLDGFNPDALSLSNMRRIAPFVDKFILTVWSPAGWMKLNKWEDGVESWASNNKLDPRYYEEYAEEIVALIRIIKRETGKDLYAIGLQNEPQFNEPYPSCQVNETEFRDIIKVVGARLLAEGLNEVKLFWAEALPAQGAIQSYINTVKADPVAKGYADIVAIHNYDADGASVGGAGCDYWQDIYTWAQAGDTKYKTWMTETSGHPDSWDGAMVLAGNIFNALECGNASAWVFWSFAVTEGSAEFGLVVGNQPSSRYYISKQYYKFIRPGAVRVAATSASIPVLAFKDDNSNSVSVILFNNTTQAQTIELKGASLPGTWESYTTSNARNCEKGAFVYEDGLIILPPSSLTTLVGNTDNPVPTLDVLSDIVLPVNAGMQSVNLTGISDGEGFDQNIVITATSDNTALIPNPSVTYTYGETTGTLTFNPTENLTGTAVITVSVTDDGEPAGVRNRSFTVTIEPVEATNVIIAGSVMIYPNPVKEVLNVAISEGKFDNYTILTSQGSVVASDYVKSGIFDINTSQLPKGVYVLVLKGIGNPVYKQFVK